MHPEHAWIPAEDQWPPTPDDMPGVKGLVRLRTGWQVKAWNPVLLKQEQPYFPDQHYSGWQRSYVAAVEKLIMLRNATPQYLTKNGCRTRGIDNRSGTIGVHLSVRKGNGRTKFVVVATMKTSSDKYVRPVTKKRTLYDAFMECLIKREQVMGEEYSAPERERRYRLFLKYARRNGYSDV